jgi:hypothetical protein
MQLKFATLAFMVLAVSVVSPSDAQPTSQQTYNTQQVPLFTTMQNQSRKYQILISGELSSYEASQKPYNVPSENLEETASGAKSYFRCETYEIEKGKLLFLNGNPPFLPISLQHAKSEFDVLTSLLDEVPSEYQEFLQNSQKGLPVGSLNNEQQEDLLRLVGLDPSSTPVSNLNVNLSFAFKMYFREPDGSFHEVTLPDRPLNPSNSASRPSAERQRTTSIETPEKPERIYPTGLMEDSREIKLPPAKDYVYRLGDLVTLLAEKTGKELHVERRCEKRLILLVVPDSVIRVCDLLEVITRVPNLYWRSLDTLWFLTHVSGTPQEADIDKINSEIKDSSQRVALAAQRNGILPEGLSPTDFNGGARQWNSLDSDRSRLFVDFINAGSVNSDNAKLRGLLNTPSRLGNSTVEFNIISIITVTNRMPNGSTSESLKAINLYR